MIATSVQGDRAHVAHLRARRRQSRATHRAARVVFPEIAVENPNEPMVLRNITTGEAWQWDGRQWVAIAYEPIAPFGFSIIAYARAEIHRAIAAQQANATNWSGRG